MSSPVRLNYTRLSPSAEEVLRSHSAHYRKMSPADAVKLLYQAAFGPGHMISDYDTVLMRTKSELLSVSESPRLCGLTPPFEEIGGDYVRMHLVPTDDTHFSADLTSFLFAESAADTSVRTEYFIASLDTLRRLAEEGVFSFSSCDLNSYLAEYTAAGMPPVSHSEEYRKNYRPAYRVIRRDYAQLMPLIRQIFSMLRYGTGSSVLFIDGMCGSGKTTLSALLSRIFKARVIPMDDFFLPPEKRTPKRLAEPGGNVDYERFRTEVMDHLNDDLLTYGVFDCSEMAVTSNVSLPKTPLTIIEGSYSCHPYFGSEPLRAHVLRIFMECGPDEQKRRILERNGEEMLRMFVSRWIPMEQKYSDAFDIRNRADYIIKT